MAEGLEGAEGGETDAVEESPENEGPADAVPESAEEKDNDRVEIGGAFPAVSVGEGGIDVVAEPVGEGDVPAFPEVGYVDGFVGAVEVVGDGEAEELAESHGDVGVAGEVEVDLQGVGVDADEDFGSAVEGWGVEDAVGDVVGEEVGDEEFLDEGPEAMSRKARPPWVGVREKGCWSCLIRSEIRLMGPATMTVKSEAEVRWVR